MRIGNTFRKIKESDKVKDFLHLLYGGFTVALADTVGKIENGKKQFIEGYFGPSVGGNSIYVKDPHWVTKNYQDVFTSVVALMSLLYLGGRLAYFEYKMHKYNKRN